MNVILFPSSVDLVGVSTHVFNLAKLLHDDGLLDVVVCPADGWLPKQLKRHRIPHAIVTMSYRPAAFVLSSMSLLHFLRSRRSADVVHVHGRFPLLVSSMSLVGSSRLRFVATVHQFAQPDTTGRLGWKSTLETFLLRRVRRICCVSADLRQETLSRIGGSNAPAVDVIPNWIEPLWYAASGHHAAPRPHQAGLPGIRICGIGRLCREKGFDVLVESLAILQREGCETRCDIFGEGPERPALLKLAGEVGISERVHFKGPSDEVRRVLPSYDVLVIPSRSESFGIVALEAFDASVPVIASDVAGLRHTVVHGRTGLLFEPGNARSLADAVWTLVRSGGLAKLLVANGRTCLEQYLPSDRLRELYRQFYGKALRDDAPSGARPRDI